MSQSDNASLSAVVELARSLQTQQNVSLGSEDAENAAALHAELIAHLTALGDERTALQLELERSRLDRRTLISAISHNVRTPLQVLALAIDAVLASQVENVRTAATSARAKRAIAMLGRQLADLEDISRIFDRELPLSLGTHRPSALLEQAASLAKERISQPVELVLESHTDAPISCDGPRIVQALALFIDNAFRHGPRNKRISLFARKDSGLRFEVHDVGSGPSAEVRSRLFQGLFRANTHHIGLGLAIAHGIAQAHGGTIGVDPSPADNSDSSGTTFYVEIPVAS